MEDDGAMELPEAIDGHSNLVDIIDCDPEPEGGPVDVGLSGV